MGHLTASLNQTIILETPYATDEYSDPSYNAGFTYPARIERRIKKVINKQGQEVVSNTLIILDGDVPLDESCQSRITLPASMGSKQVVILAIEDARDQSGVNDHWEVST